MWRFSPGELPLTTMSNAWFRAVRKITVRHRLRVIVTPITGGLSKGAIGAWGGRSRISGLFRFGLSRLALVFCCEIKHPDACRRIFERFRFATTFFCAHSIMLAKGQDRKSTRLNSSH